MILYLTFHPYIINLLTQLLNMGLEEMDWKHMQKDKLCTIGLTLVLLTTIGVQAHEGYSSQFVCLLRKTRTGRWILPL